MKNKLQQYFPMIRTRKEIMADIKQSEKLSEMFYHWDKEYREEFLDFCTGAKGVKMMYDFVSKEILNPESHRERVNNFLSLLLGQCVRVLEVLPNDGTRLAEESTLMIMDIVVELEDGSIVNLEIQKIGYMFPGERSACYSADLLLRQYKRVQRKLKQKKLNAKNCYREIKDVYTIVLFEHSPGEFHEVPDVYIHRFEQGSDSGVRLNLLQKYLFVSLDIFSKIKHNESNMIHLDNRLEAWFAFFCMDDPEDIMVIIEQYPDFRELYEQVYEICRNVEDIMGLFSKELAELDHNTAEYMVDVMQKQLDQKKQELQSTTEELMTTNVKLQSTNEELQSTSAKLQDANEELQSTSAKLQDANEELQSTSAKLQHKEEELQKLKAAYAELLKKAEA